MSRSNVILAGLIGAGIQASRTPAMHEREGDAQGLRYLYRLIDLDQLGLDSGALPELLGAAERMARIAKARELMAANDIGAALEDLLATQPAPMRILICGSLYLAGEVLVRNG